MKKYSNQLIHETSPYLLQHAHNPVNWFPWGDEALNKAKEENKPILVSIGYSACHWCHVMEKESFEDEATAKLMNENFINIKIDREERPDLDHIYMDAVQAISGSGGWPLNVFLTPGAKPFYGGTYFPPQRAFNRPSWTETLLGVIQAFKERRHEIDAQAENLTDHLLQSNAFGLEKMQGDEIFTSEKVEEAFQNIMKAADTEWGGFGKAPKFPQTFSILFLLRYSYVQKFSKLPGSPTATVPLERGRGEVAFEQALLSLDKMIEGGLYDQVGGGFARYATDTEWLAPHFEKMLYDNALLITVLSEAYQLTKRERYREVIKETMDFLQREMLHKDKASRPDLPAGKGFYSALDADSDGVEGKFYVWSLKEIEEVLGEDAVVFCEYYDVTAKGNWSEGTSLEEGINILRVKKSIRNFATEKSIVVADVKNILEEGKKKLLKKRSERIRPLLDDKIILGWNALMNIACSKAFEATGEEVYKQLAIDNMYFLLQKFSAVKENEFHHTWKNDKGKYPAFLDDYAFLIQALLNLQQITADVKWLMNAKSLTEFVIENFSEAGTGFFFYTPVSQPDVIVRKKEVYDGAVPSGNSVMAYNLHHLSLLFDRKDWEKRSYDMVSSLSKAIGRYPTSFGNWSCLLLEIITGTNEIAIVGKNYYDLQKEVLINYIPHKILMAAIAGNPSFPLLKEKAPLEASIYLCRNYTCQHPVFSAKELILLINKAEKG